MKREQRLEKDVYGKAAMHASHLFLRALPLLLVLLAFLPGEADSQQGGVIATIININGRVEYRENEKADWKPARKSDALYQGYQLRTETGNKAMILYNNSGSRVLVNENTQIEIQAEAAATGAKPTKERTKIIMGEIYSRISSGKNYEVETPSSVASVRGTEFDSKYNIETDEATYVVLVSTIELMNQLGSVILQQLQTSTVKLGEKPQEPKTLSKGDAQKLTVWTKGVEPKWRLNLAPEGGADHEVSGVFDIGLTVLDTKTTTIDNSASFDLRSFTSSSDIIEFSTDSGKTWSATPVVRVVNGVATVRARVKAEGSAEITAAANDAEPSVISINVTKAKDRKRVEIQFTSPDGKVSKTLILELEEK
jgi:hypothetical protein